MNKVIFCGRTTKDIEMRYSQGENSMAIGRFSIAINSSYGDKKKTNFFNCTIFGKQAEAFEKYVPKGTKVLLECEANQNQYTDKNGNKVNSVDFIVKSFEFCESKSKSNSQPQPTQSVDMGFMNIDTDMDSLPFN